MTVRRGIVQWNETTCNTTKKSGVRLLATNWLCIGFTFVLSVNISTILQQIFGYLKIVVT